MGEVAEQPLPFFRLLLPLFWFDHLQKLRCDRTDSVGACTKRPTVFRERDIPLCDPARKFAGSQTFNDLVNGGPTRRMTDMAQRWRPVRSTSS
jgi:hypothetical protein